MDRVKIKSVAKEFAFNNKWEIWKPILVVMIVVFVFEYLIALLTGYNNGQDTNPGSLLSMIVLLAEVPLNIGMLAYLLSFVRGKKLDLKETLFSKYKFFIPIVVTYFIVAVFISLWSLLLIVPGIIYAYKTIMVPYILADEVNENTKFKDAINKSKVMMDGYKSDYFVFQLSFIGWVLLGFITFGIAYIWVVPYMSTAQIMYYEELKKISK